MSESYPDHISTCLSHPKCCFPTNQIILSNISKIQPSSAAATNALPPSISPKNTDMLHQPHSLPNQAAAGVVHKIDGSIVIVIGPYFSPSITPSSAPSVSPPSSRSTVWSEAGSLSPSKRRISSSHCLIRCTDVTSGNQPARRRLELTASIITIDKLIYLFRLPVASAKTFA
jgi:hypothetical protein